MTPKHYDDDFKKSIISLHENGDCLIHFLVNMVFPFLRLLDELDCMQLFILKKDRALLLNKLKICKKEMLL